MTNEPSVTFPGKWCFIAMIAASSGFVAGCNRGPAIAKASGMVVFEDGTPVKVGTIETKHAELEGVQARGSIREDGTFVLGTVEEADGAAVGEHRCVVVQFVMTEDVPGFKPSTEGVVNPAHASYATSGLTIQVPEEGTSTLKLVVRGVRSGRGSQRGHGEHQELPEGATPATP
ncbi:hypothetical protein SH467x_003920 [Pirellulaceae bacterium SH467]